MRTINIIISILPLSHRSRLLSRLRTNHPRIYRSIWVEEVDPICSENCFNTLRSRRISLKESRDEKKLYNKKSKPTWYGNQTVYRMVTVQASQIEKSRVQTELVTDRPRFHNKWILIEAMAKVVIDKQEHLSH